MSIFSTHYSSQSGKTQDVSMISGSGQFFYGISIQELYSFPGFLFGFSPKPRTMGSAWQRNIPIGSVRLVYLYLHVVDFNGKS